jgi:DNA-binding transcriptional LysR family regulator
VDVHQLRIFVSVYRNRSFSKASKENHISQPTISEHIKNLELALNCRLFDRLGRSIVPTKEAEILYPKALHIIENLDDLRDEMTRASGAIKGKLLVGASTIPGTYILPVVASRFKKNWPDVSFEIMIDDSSRITEMVLAHDIQLGVVGAVIETGKLDYVPFIQDELILAGSPTFVKKTLIDIMELIEIPFILREEGSGTRRTMEELFKNKKGVSVNNLEVVAVLGSTDSVKQALKAGLGVSILSRIAIQDELKNGFLKEIKIKGLQMKRHFHIIKHRRRSLPNHYQAFYDYLKEKNIRQK